ncbi:MAG: glycerol kinase GlpK [Sneathiellaceae bacterium]
MTSDAPILVIDQGTTSTRAILFGPDGSTRGLAQRELPQIYPAPGWVEHDGMRIWEDVQAVVRDAIAAAGVEPGAIAGIGITNQRETTLVWDRSTGRPIHNAIVWQDRRTASICEQLRQKGAEDLVRDRTGLLLDPYFSATKIAWLLTHVPGAEDHAARGELAFGTIDSFLVWHLTGGRCHVTDATNAGRTMLLDIHKGAWDPDLLRLFAIPRGLLPKVVDSAGVVGTCDPALFGAAIPIAGLAGDQHAATFGQAAFSPGMVKSTYGTGCFALANTGDRPVRSSNRLLTTIAWQLDGRRTYALEGAIFVAGAAVQWLRDGLGVIKQAAETDGLARQVEDTGGVYLVPAFTGLGAPWWDPDARAAILGMTRATGVPEIARATLEAVAYQTRDLMQAMIADGIPAPQALRVDGGLSANDWVMQFLADILDLPVERPVTTETTALGAAYLAGLAQGVYRDMDDLAQRWQRERRFEPVMSPGRRTALCDGWDEAVRRVLTP